MNKIKQEDRILIKEIRYLITPQIFYLQLYKDKGVAVGVAWVSDFTIDVSELYFVRLDKWKMKKCLTIEQLNYRMETLESRIGSVCRLCDTVAKNRGIDKIDFFDGLILEAEKW